MKHNKFIVCLCVSILFLVFPVCSLQATVVSWDIGLIFIGTGVPTNPAPWLNATFNDGGSAGTVDLKITAFGLTANERVGGVYFNLDTALNPTQLVFSAPIKTGTFDDPAISKGVDGYKADGDGYYDVLIKFDEDGVNRAFNGGEAVEYTITLASLTANSFDFVSAPGGGTGQYVTAAHLQSLGTTLDSAWATNTPPAIPEPATLSLLVIGGLFLGKRKK